VTSEAARFVGLNYTKIWLGGQINADEMGMAHGNGTCHMTPDTRNMARGT
jgi:hypothetical protein